MKFYTVRAIALAAVLTSGVALIAQQTTRESDNTRINKRDQNKAEPTADQQKENRSDRDIAKMVRKSITDDKALSTYARNVKVIAQNGTVTLKGPVRSEEEKKTIEGKAAEVAGASNIKSETTIEPEQKSR
jgi:hyperosmotically inducible periplasmic protein